MREHTEQELFWAGEFGNAYTQRNQALAQARMPFFEQILSHCSGLGSVSELGANCGQNLLALKSLKPELELHAVEINPLAFEQLQQIPGLEAVCQPIQDYQPGRMFDLVFTSGVMIHLAPEDLPLVYQKMFELSKRYILINEYFNPTPVEISYRGHAGKLFKRDFAGEFLDRYADTTQVLAYGFLWNRMHPAWDNTTWTLIEKKPEL